MLYSISETTNDIDVMHQYHLVQMDYLIDGYHILHSNIDLLLETELKLQ